MMRAIEKRRKPFMTRNKWIALFIFIFVVIITALTVFYRSIQLDHWKERDYVKKSLREFFVIDTIDYAEKYTWDDTFWIVKGKTPADAEMYVLWKELVIIDRISINEMVTEQSIRENFSRLVPNATIKSIMPAYFNKQFSWEVQYFSEETNHTHFAFYSMKTGEMLETYTIPNKTGS